VATLESLVASLRRAGLQQEKTIAALRRARSVVTDRSPTNGDAGAGKQA
jgi:hypothetical protein